MSIPVTPIAAANQVNEYTQLAALLTALRQTNDRLPKTSLPTEIPGTVQGDVHLLPPITIYTDHGRLASNKGPGNLLGRA